MRKQLFKRTVSWLIVLCMVLSLVPAASAADGLSWKQVDREITADMGRELVQKDENAEAYDDSEMVRVSIVLEGASTIEAGYSTMGIGQNSEAMAYRQELRAVQERMEKTISVQALGGRPLDVVWNMTLVGNIISAWVPYGKIDQIAAIPGVRTVAMEARYEPCVAEVSDVEPSVYPSSGMIGSGELWEGGYTGAGTRIAIIDTGTDTTHQSFDNGAYLYALTKNAAAKGMSVESYMESLDLLTAEQIAAVLPEMNVYELDPEIEAGDLYHNEKLAFGYNYVDANLNIEHNQDYQGEHGSHVAGISTANRYIPRNGYYVDAAANVMMVGVAPDAQLLTMKVFGEESPFDSDYMAAIEDAILLDCDAVNLSLGSTAPGSPYTTVYSELLEMLKGTDTVVAIAAGNAANWAASSMWGYLYNDDVSFNEVGEPGSYESAFTVASVENDGNVGYYIEANGVKAFYVETLGYGNTSMVTLDTSLDLNGTEYEYIFLDGLGYEEEYAGIDVSGKVVLVSRGTLNFAVKANNALSRGAVAVIIYNNQEGVSNMDLTGLSYAAPVVSITQAEGAAIRAASEDKGTYRTGKMRIPALMGAVTHGSEYYTMSEFSSWGVPGNLTLKPEITAPGGMIYSVWGTNAVNGGGSDKYETMSGTSMATPQVAGMTALLAQYFEENGVTEKTGMSARHLAQSLLMSTAQPLFEEASGGNYYSLLNQGAGLARVDLAAQAESYVLVEGQDDGKVKAELGDDPERNGVYEFGFSIHNMTDTQQTYALEADAFRQDVFEYMEDSDVWLLDTWTTALEADVTFTADVELGAVTSDVDCDLNGDGVTNAGDADHLLEYLVGNETELKADGDLSGDGVANSYDAHLLLAQLTGQTVTIPAGGTVNVSVKLALTDAAKAELDAETPRGTYVEAFVYARSVADAEGDLGVTHSIPMLAFYGDWSEPSMFDRGTLVEHMYLAVNKGPYLYYFIGPYGNALSIDYGDGNEYYYGGNPMVDDAAYLPERNAMTSSGTSRLVEQGFTLIRGAGDARMRITNADTGEVYFERLLGELYPAYYNASAGRWENTIQYAKLNWAGTDGAGAPLAEGTNVEISLTAVPHYYQDENGNYSFDGLGEGSTMTTRLTIDNTAPQALDIDIDEALEGKLTVRAKDNEYVAAVALLNATGSKLLAVQSPNQTQKNVEVTVDLDVSAVTGKTFLVAVYDYASNVTTYEVTLNLPGPERQYFTAINSNTGTYVSMDMAGNLTDLATLDIPTPARAAEYVDGYVFTVTSDKMLCVANDADLTVTTRITELDAKNEWLIDSVADMAYNYADGQLYMLFYSELNGSAVPYLCTMDLGDGSLNVLGEMPVDVHTLAIDGNGTFYSAAWGSPSLYKYTVAQAMSGNVTYIGEMSYYGTEAACSMAWDHNANTLYFAYPNTLLRINTETAEPTLLGYYTYQLVGLYIRSGEPSGRFDPTDEVDRMELSLTDTRVLKGADLTLEATVWPWNVSDSSVTWTTSDAGVTTVSNGVVTGVGVGSCVITATSNLDASVSASCTVEVFEMEKTLNAIVWDEAGEIWWSEFNTSDLPNYTKLSDKSIGKDFASATVDEDGSIYAATLDNNTMKSELYKVDPTTFEPTLIGPSTDAYMDIAPAPGMPGDSLMAVYGGNILNVDATTGDYYNFYYMFSYNLVGLAYVGTTAYQEWGYDTMVDWYFIIDRIGYVYLMGFLEQDGAYYYLEHDSLAPGGIYTKLDFEMDTPYFGSAYFDGEFLYYSAYKQSRDNVTLMAIDVAGGSKACYTLGTFADGVWPVAGLMELGTMGGNVDILSTTAKPVSLEPQAELTGIRKDAEGTLSSAPAPMSGTDIKDKLVTIDVTVPVDATNATMGVCYDPAALELVDVEGMTTAFAWKAADGKIDLAAAEGESIPAETVLARLTFKPLGEEETEVTILHEECSDTYLELAENFTIDLSFNCPSAQFVDVVKPSWYHEAVDYVVEQGYMNGMDSAHFGPAVSMNRAQFVTVLYRMEGEPEVALTDRFTDVKEGSFYAKAVAWAVEAGITTGATATTFNPGGQLSRSELVTFMYRYAGYKGYDTTAAADLSGYSDAGLVPNFSRTAWSWALTHGIVTGVTSTTLAPRNLTNRAQAAVIFQRLDNTFA